MIKNNNSERRVAIVNIDGKERIVKEGTTLNELKVVKIEKETITVSFQDEQKTKKQMNLAGKLTITVVAFFLFSEHLSMLKK